MTLDTQIKTIEEYCKKMFFEEREERVKHFIDNGVSGITPAEERPALKELFDLITSIRNQKDKMAQPFSPINVIIYDPDRLSRDILVFQNILNFFSNKCVKVLYASLKENEGENTDMLVMFKTIIAEQERKNTIRRINNFFKINESKWDTKRVGFGYERYDKSLSLKIKNDKEYETLMLIKQKYEEDGESLADIASFLNEQMLFNRGEKEWTTSALDYIISKNKFVWGGVNKLKVDSSIRSEGEERSSDIYTVDAEKKIIYIKDMDCFLNLNWNENEGYTLVHNGKKVSQKILAKRKLKEEINSQVKKKIEFWLVNEKNKYYSNSEIYKKIRTEFKDDNTYIKRASDRVLWDLVNDVRKKFH